VGEGGDGGGGGGGGGPGRTSPKCLVPTQLDFGGAPGLPFNNRGGGGVFPYSGGWKGGLLFYGLALIRPSRREPKKKGSRPDKESRNREKVRGHHTKQPKKGDEFFISRRNPTSGRKGKHRGPVRGQPRKWGTPPTKERRGERLSLLHGGGGGTFFLSPGVFFFFSRTQVHWGKTRVFWHILVL